MDGLEATIAAKIVRTIIKDKKFKEDVDIEVIESEKLSDEDFDSCLTLLDQNLGMLYTIIKGHDWKTEKIDEMKEEGLVYLLIKENGKFSGFLSFNLVKDDELSLLYLYEIQLMPQLRNKGLGTELLNLLEIIVKELNASKELRKLWFDYFEEINDLNDPYLEITGIGLTVFSQNNKAFEFYQRNGYDFHNDSPKDRILRNKVFKPSYYLLEKHVKDTFVKL